MFHYFSKINVGIYSMTAVFLSIAINSFFANITVQTHLYITRMIICLSNIYIVINWIIALIGFNNKNSFKSKFALILWSIYIFFWIGAMILSLTVSGEVYMCSGGRCPESMWLLKNLWHNNYVLALDTYYDLDYDYSIVPVTVWTTPAYDYTAKEHLQSPKPNDDAVWLERNAELKSSLTLGRLSDLQPEVPSNDLKLKRRKKPHEHHGKSTGENAMVILINIFMFGMLVYGWLVLFSSHHIKNKVKENK